MKSKQMEISFAVAMCLMMEIQASVRCHAEYRSEAVLLSLFFFFFLFCQMKVHSNIFGENMCIGFLAKFDSLKVS